MTHRRQLAGLLVLAGMTAQCEPVAAQPLAEHHSSVVLRVRRGSRDPVALPAAVASLKSFQSTDNRTFAQVFGWSYPMLESAFDAAEVAIGGTRGSITKDAPARVILYFDFFPFCGTDYDDTNGRLDIYLSTGMLNFIMGSSGALTLDGLRTQWPMVESHAGLGIQDWWAAMREGQAFNEAGSISFPGPLPPLSENYWEKYIRDPAFSVLTFVFAHELAHVHLRQPSGSGADALPIEKAVDEEAFRKLYRMAGVHIPFPVAFMLSLAYWQAAYADDLNAFVSAPGSLRRFTEVFPATDWVARIRNLLSIWTSERERTPNNPLTTLPGAQGAEVMMREFIAYPMPPPNSKAKQFGYGFQQAFKMLLVAAKTNFQGYVGELNGEHGPLVEYDCTLAIPEVLDIVINKIPGSKTIHWMAEVELDVGDTRAAAVRARDSWQQRMRESVPRSAWRHNDQLDCEELKVGDSQPVATVTLFAKKKGGFRIVAYVPGSS